MPEPQFIPDSEPEFIPDEQAAPSLLDTILSKGKSVLGAIQDVNIGAGKGALNTAYNIDKFAVNKLTPWTLPDQQDVLSPTNTPQKVGKGIEQTGEFMLPGAAGLNDVTAAMKVGKSAPALAKILSLVGRSGLEGASTAGVAAAQGSDAKTVGTAAAAGAATPVLGDILNPVTEYLAKKIPGRIYNTIIRPAQNDYKFGKNPGAAVADEGLTANTVGDLADKITTQKAQVGKQIETTLKGPSASAQTIDATKLIEQPIRDAQTAAIKNGEQALYDRLENLYDGLMNNFQVQKGKMVIAGPKNMQLSPEDVWQIKKDVGDATRWTGQAFDNDVNQVRVQIYSNLKSAINKAVPEVESLNGRYANLLTAQKGIEKRIAVLNRNNLITPTDIIAGLAGGVGSAAKGEDWESSLKNAGLGIALNKALGSTALKTREAQALRETPSAENILRLIRSGALGGASANTTGGQ